MRKTQTFWLSLVYNKSNYCILSLALLFFANCAQAVLFDFTTQPLTIEPNSISLTTNGVTAKTTAHHVEFNNGVPTIFGPFMTGNIGPRQVFGTNTSTIGNPGLGLTSAQSFGQQDLDLPAGGLQPGFDNNPSTSVFVDPNTQQSVQFALFSFDKPIDVSQVIVDDVSNFGRNVWIAGGSSAPDLSMSFVDAFADFDIVNSPDDISDGIFVHDFDPFQDISYLAVGTAPSVDFGNIGPFVARSSNQFYINALNFDISPDGGGDGMDGGNGTNGGNGTDGNGTDGGVNTVPEPSSIGLLLLGMAAYGIIGRRRKVLPHLRF